MTTPTRRIADLERTNYTAMLPSAEATPGLNVQLLDDVVLVSSPSLPGYDSNHACLLQARAGSADALISRVIRYFHEKGLPVAIYVSPACTPRDLPKLLRERGFREQAEEEAWLVAGDLPHFALPRPEPGIAVRKVTKREIHTFAEVFMAAFHYPPESVPLLLQLLGPSVELPNTRHYLAYQGQETIGTFSLLCHGNVGILGSAGVLGTHRQSGAGRSMWIRAMKDAREAGVETVILQTRPDTWLEGYLRGWGFQRLFTRSCFVLDDELPG